MLNQHFNRIFIVTNQRGVGKGVMTREALDEIHLWMLQRITAAGGRIDKIYTCTDINDDSPNRKCGLSIRNGLTITLLPS